MTSPLTHETCSLLNKHAPERVDDLVSAFNAVHKGLALYREASPHSDYLDRLAQKLDSVRGLLCRERYRVGLMGPFQVGKSSAFNRIIGSTSQGTNTATQNSLVAKEGGGSATTAVLTRLYAKDGGDPSLSIQHVTEDLFQQKLAYLKRVTNLLEVSSLDELERHAHAKYEAYEQGERERIKDSHGIYFVEAIDLKYLRLLILSYRKYRSQIAKDSTIGFDNAPRGLTVDYAVRDKYLNHPERFIEHGFTWNDISAIEDPISPVIACAEIHFPSSVLPSDVVIVDTPGLGSMGRIDEWLFDQSVKELDAAIVVPDTARPMDESVQKIFQRLYAAERHFTERTWVMASKCDAISETFAAHKTEGFNLYRELANANDFDLSRVSFFTIYPEGLCGRFGDEVVSHLRNMGLDPLVDAWKAAREDGGVSRMRHIIRYDLARTIGRQLADECSRELHTLRRDVEQLLRQAVEDAKSIDPRLEDRMRRASEKLRAGALKLLEEPEWFHEHVKGMTQQLREAITLDAEHLELAHLDSEFEHHTAALEREYGKYLRDQFARQAYDDVRRKLLESLEVEGAITIPIDAPEGLVAKWNELRDEGAHAFVNMSDSLPSFVRNSPFEDLELHQTNPYTVDDYIGLLHAKMYCVGEQTAQVLRLRLSKQLKWLSQAVHQHVQRQRAGIDSAQAKEIERRANELGFR